MARSAQAGAIAELAARWALALVFIYAGALKTLDPAGFALSIDHYRLLPYPLAAAVAVYLPWLEIAGGVGVVWPRARLGALSLLLGLCLFFSGAIASALFRGLDISCGCFGNEAGIHASLGVGLIRSMFLAVIAWWLLWRGTRACPANDSLPGRKRNDNLPSAASMP
jgi:putative oxidoreductase